MLSVRVSLAVSLLLAVSPSINAQSSVTTTGGAASFIARFDSTTTILQSGIYQDANGNIGIGTTTPAASFHVNGKATVGDGAVWPTDFTFQISSANPTLLFHYPGHDLASISLAHDGPENSFKFHAINPVYDGLVGIDVEGKSFLRGNVGIGLSNSSPSAPLEVNGSVKITAGSNGSIIFSDGSSQNTALNSTASGLGSGSSFFNAIGFVPYQAPAGSTTTGAVLNKGFALISNSPHHLRIATLPASSSGSLDHLHIVATLNPNWNSNQNQVIDAVFANRSGFVYQYTLRGAQPSSNAKLTAYQTSSGDIDIYLSFPGSFAFTDGTYSILENMAAIVYADPTDLANPTGTLLFDSSSSSYPPSSYLSWDGSLGLGTTNPTAKLEVVGNIKLSGTGASITFPSDPGTPQTMPWTGTLCGGDYAESVLVGNDRTAYQPGDILVINEEKPDTFLRSADPYSRMVAGVYSTKPGVVGRRLTGTKSDAEVPMAMVGIVPAKVSAENGPIRPGDLLVTSSTLGHVMKGTDPSRLTGAVVGKAMGRLDAGTGMIEVLVSLQ